MKTYKISLRTPVITVKARSETEAKQMFWEEFDTYHMGYPDEEDMVVTVLPNGEV